MATAFRTSNPALNEKTFAPEHLHTLQVPADAPPGQGWRTTMTLDGVVMKSMLLIALLVVSGVVGWQGTETSEAGVELPAWLFLAVIGGLGVAVLTIFKPLLARFTAPLYAVIEGLVLGAISAAYEFRFDGIVLQAVGLTIGVFLIMLLAYATRLIKVTERFRLGVVAATGAVFVVYLVTMVMRLFGTDVAFIHDSGLFGILFSLAVVGIAALNLVLDFDLIEKGVANQAPKQLEWYAGFGLLVTLVWLYLELLRLLSKLRR